MKQVCNDACMSTTRDTLAALAALQDEAAGNEVGKLLRQLDKADLVDALVFMSGAAPAEIRRAFSHTLRVHDNAQKRAAERHAGDSGWVSGSMGTGQVADDDNETVVLADESEWMDNE